MYSLTINLCDAVLSDGYISFSRKAKSLVKNLSFFCRELSLRILLKLDSAMVYMCACVAQSLGKPNTHFSREEKTEELHLIRTVFVGSFGTKMARVLHLVVSFISSCYLITTG